MGPGAARVAFVERGGSLSSRRPEYRAVSLPRRVSFGPLSFRNLTYECGEMNDALEAISHGFDADALVPDSRVRWAGRVAAAFVLLGRLAPSVSLPGFQTLKESVRGFSPSPLSRAGASKFLAQTVALVSASGLRCAGGRRCLVVAVAAFAQAPASIGINPIIGGGGPFHRPDLTGCGRAHCQRHAADWLPASSRSPSLVSLIAVACRPVHSTGRGRRPGHPAHHWDLEPQPGGVGLPWLAPSPQTHRLPDRRLLLGLDRLERGPCRRRSGLTGCRCRLERGVWSRFSLASAHHLRRRSGPNRLPSRALRDGDSRNSNRDPAPRSSFAVQLSPPRPQSVNWSTSTVAITPGYRRACSQSRGPIRPRRSLMWRPRSFDADTFALPAGRGLTRAALGGAPPAISWYSATIACFAMERRDAPSASRCRSVRRTGAAGHVLGVFDARRCCSGQCRTTRRGVCAFTILNAKGLPPDLPRKPPGEDPAISWDSLCVQARGSSTGSSRLAPPRRRFAAASLETARSAPALAGPLATRSSPAADGTAGQIGDLVTARARWNGFCLQSSAWKTASERNLGGTCRCGAAIRSAGLWRHLGYGPVGVPGESRQLDVAHQSG